MVLPKNGQRIEIPIIVAFVLGWLMWWIDVEFSKNNYNKKEVKNS
jgi:hypothetical protein